MGLNIGQPLSSGLLSITNKGLIASNNTIFTGSFTMISSSTQLIYAYNKDYYKNKTNKRKYNKRRTLKIYKD